jgi:hypothetical protein
MVSDKILTHAYTVVFRMTVTSVMVLPVADFCPPIKSSWSKFHPDEFAEVPDLLSNSPDKIPIYASPPLAAPANPKQKRIAPTTIKEIGGDNKKEPYHISSSPTNVNISTRSIFKFRKNFIK